MYRVFHVILLQEQGCLELVLGLMMSLKAFSNPKTTISIHLSKVCFGVVLCEWSLREQVPPKTAKIRTYAKFSLPYLPSKPIWTEKNMDMGLIFNFRSFFWTCSLPYSGVWNKYKQGEYAIFLKLRTSNTILHIRQKLLPSNQIINFLR